MEQGSGEIGGSGAGGASVRNQRGREWMSMRGLGWRFRGGCEGRSGRGWEVPWNVPRTRRRWVVLDRSASCWRGAIRVVVVDLLLWRREIRGLMSLSSRLR